MDSSKEASEENSDEGIEDEDISDLWLGLLIKGRIFKSNGEAMEQSKEPSEDDGETFQFSRTKT